MKTERKKKENARKRKIVLVKTLLPIVFTAVSLVCALLFLRNAKIGVFARKRTFFLGASLVFFLLYGGINVWTGIAKKNVAYRALISGYALFSFMLAFAVLLQKTGFFDVVRDVDSLKEYLRGAGSWMPAAYVLLQYLQVVVLPIPGFVSTAAGVALFGPFFTTIYSFIGVAFGSFTAFFIGRKFGSKATAWIVGKDNIEKWRKKFANKERFLLTAAFLLPVFPDDLLCFVAGLSETSAKFFVVTVLWARGVSVAATAYFVSFVPPKGIGIWIWGMIAVLTITLAVLYGKFNRSRKDKRP